MPPASTPVATGNIRWNKMKHPEYILTVLLSMLAVLTEGTLYLIEPETPYGSENGNYYDESTRAYQEQYGPASARPAINKTLKEADGYDTILLGFPIWYGKAPRVVFSFLDTYSFKGKTVIFFATSGGSSIDKANADFKDQYPEIDWKAGKTLNSESKAEIKAWAEGLK